MPDNLAIGKFDGWGTMGINGQFKGKKELRARKIERPVIVLNLKLVTDNSELIAVNPE